MAHLLALGFEIFFRVGCGLDFAGDAFGDLDAALLEGRNLVGIIREKPNGFDVQSLEDRYRHVVVATVGFETKLFVCLHGIEPLILKLVGLELCHEADAAALLLFINEDSGAGFGDHLESHFKLLAAVAAQRTENVPGETLRVDADERRLGMDVAHHEGDGFFAAALAFIEELAHESKDAELSPAGGKLGLGNLPDRWFGHGHHNYSCWRGFRRMENVGRGTCALRHCGMYRWSLPTSNTRFVRARKFSKAM